LKSLLLTVISGNVSLVDLTVNLEKETSLAQIMNEFQVAANGGMKHVLHVEHDELVSCDFQGNSHSAVIDAKACLELNPKVASPLSNLMSWSFLVNQTYSFSRFWLGMITSGHTLQG
jgi:glyceraldehyde 3-phosphate dehydrogenase